MKKVEIKIKPDTALEEMSGKMDYTMTNDILFHIVMQSSNEALKGLIEALLDMEPGTVKSAVVQNPISYGDGMELKEIILDVLVLLNDNQYINIEMQVRSFAAWTNRAVFYLCRIVSDQNPGDEYKGLKPVIHVGILDHTLFKEKPSFYAEYCLMDPVRNQQFTDKVSIRVLDLTRTDLADVSTENGKRLLYWAEAFKASTWEDIKKVSEKDSSIGEAAKTMCAAISDEETKRMIRMREDAMRDWMTQVRAREDAERKAEQAEKELEQANSELRQASSELEHANSELQKARSEIERLHRQNQELMRKVQ